ncbi:serine/threonine-protein phosphatase 7 long form-like protein, partial [Trifolium medium]|nr:serine/threonine-protein phosphatase 7 long form-like protein [Trifolium medium]
GYQHLDPYLISADAERWHDETSNFHMPVGEITVTLDDVSCLLHLPFRGRLLDHIPITKIEDIDLMVRLLGSDPADADTEVTKTK